jgi:hypothetical protein
MAQSIVNDFNGGLTLGRGQIMVATLNSARRLPKNAPFEFLGNCPEFNLTVETEDLEHFKSTRGVSEKDASITLRTNRTSTVVCDDIKNQNLARYLFGSIQTIVTTPATETADPIDSVQLGFYYQLGVTAQNPTGVKAIDATSVVVTSNPVGTTYVVDEDYVVNAQRGMISFLTDGAINEGDDLLVTYDTVAASFQRVISGNTPIRVAVKFIAENAEGPQREVFMPNVNIRPEGDLGFISGDDWAQIGLNFEILPDPVNNVAIYIDGEPVIA